MIKDLPSIIQKLNIAISTIIDDFQGTYLFGSSVAGITNIDSDIDIVVLFNHIDKDKKFKIYEIISSLMYEYDVFIDIKILTPELLQSNPFFYDEVTSKGIFYAAA
jgi:predicted nucleotidyltransferase